MNGEAGRRPIPLTATAKAPPRELLNYFSISVCKTEQDACCLSVMHYFVSVLQERPNVLTERLLNDGRCARVTFSAFSPNKETVSNDTVGFCAVLLLQRLMSREREGQMERDVNRMSQTTISSACLVSSS